MAFTIRTWGVYQALVSSGKRQANSIEYRVPIWADFAMPLFAVVTPPGMEDEFYLWPERLFWWLWIYCLSAACQECSWICDSEKSTCRRMWGSVLTVTDQRNPDRSDQEVLATPIYSVNGSLCRVSSIWFGLLTCCRNI